MKVLVTGNRGYIGQVLTELLAKTRHSVTGYDNCYYDDCFLAPPVEPSCQIKKDIREATLEDFKGKDAVVHLAALSNDPLGELRPSLTEEINLRATVYLAELAKKAGVRRFVYASSQSMYGLADTKEELTEESAGAYGTTAYARTKWQAEVELKRLCSADFIVVCMRPSTVFGVSPNLRCDIVFNNFVACAYTTGRIEVKSDGTPWRPAVHVRDVSLAFIAALEAAEELVQGQSFNVGIPNGNFTVRDLALTAQKGVPGSTLVFTGEHGKDARTYRVSFAKILTVLRDYYRPGWDLQQGAKELVEFFKYTNFTEQQFRGRMCNRLGQLKHLIDSQKIDSTLRWS
jgi:nucleoside-diphosphate-sugar epimerase